MKNVGSDWGLKKLPVLLIFLAFTFLNSCSSNLVGFNSVDLDLRDTVYVHEIHWAGSIDNTKQIENLHDNFIEIRNFYEAPIDISRWSIIIQGEMFQLIIIPDGTILGSKDYYTIGRSTNGAFSHFNLIINDLVIPNSGFILTISDQTGKYSDRFALTNVNRNMPAGEYNENYRKSMVRVVGFFGPEDGNFTYNWETYKASLPSTNVRPEYNTSMFCSPGYSVSGE